MLSAYVAKDEEFPLLPAAGTQYWHAGLSEDERNTRLERWRERYFNVVARFRCDPRLYDHYRSHYLPTEGLLDPIYDRGELDKLRRTLFDTRPPRPTVSRLARLREQSRSSPN